MSKPCSTGLPMQRQNPYTEHTKCEPDTAVSLSISRYVQVTRMQFVQHQGPGGFSGVSHCLLGQLLLAAA